MNLVGRQDANCKWLKKWRIRWGGGNLGPSLVESAQKREHPFHPGLIDEPVIFWLSLGFVPISDAEAFRDALTEAIEWAKGEA